MAILTRRREFIVAISGAAAAWPLAGHALQAAMPVIGFCHLISPEARHEYLAYFHRGLADIGYIEGRNVEIEYRWGYGQNDRLPILIAELVRQQVAVIAILESTHGALSAKAATQTIPIVFMQGADSVQIGLVRSLDHPGGNVTGFDLHLVEKVAKRLELLHEAVPRATSIAYLRNPTNPVYAQAETTEVQAAARSLGVRLLLLDASTPNEVETAFANLVQQQAGALLLSGDGKLNFTLQNQIIALAARHAIPAMYSVLETVKAGGLMSYGLDQHDGWRQAGIYTGRILKGERPADLPVQRVTKVELALNVKTAKALGLTFPNHFARPRRRGDRIIAQPPRHFAASAYGSFWPIATEIHVAWHVGNQDKSGLVVLNVSFVARYPRRTSRKSSSTTVVRSISGRLSNLARQSLRN